jgi:hypothetical protein
LELDGLIEGIEYSTDGKLLDAVFEVKIFSNPNKATFNSFFNKAYSQLSTYDNITKRNSKKYIVIVVKDEKLHQTIKIDEFKSNYEKINKDCIDYNSLGESVSRN